jgi:hypothetical protein
VRFSVQHDEDGFVCPSRCRVCQRYVASFVTIQFVDKDVLFIFLIKASAARESWIALIQR